MRNRFNTADADAFISAFPKSPKEVALCAYISRILGAEPELVLHGGGNSSVKMPLADLFGEYHEVIFVKGSGKDMAVIDPKGFCALTLDPLKKLRLLKNLTDEELENQLSVHRIRANAPDPSVEVLLHALLPHRFVLHTHAESILILSGRKDGKQRLETLLGKNVAILPYQKSGLMLAKAVATGYEKSHDINAIVIRHHGIFTFADDAKIAYSRMIKLAGAAESHIRAQLKNKPLTVMDHKKAFIKNPDHQLARVCQVIRGLCARPEKEGGIGRCYTETRRCKELIDVSLSSWAKKICHSGVLTPDHAIWTRNQIAYVETVSEKDDNLKKTVQKCISDFQNEYGRYLQLGKNVTSVDSSIDSMPILFLVKGLGLIATGLSCRSAKVAADIGKQTILAKLKGFALGNFSSIPKMHVVEMEFWPLQKKKQRGSSRLPLGGQVAVVTGAGGAIGFGIAKQLLKAGAAVVLTDIDRFRLEKAFQLLSEEWESDRIERFTFDVTDFGAVETSFEAISLKFGGIDILVPNAGIAHVARIEDLEPEQLDRVVAVNLKGTFNVIKAAVPIFRRQGTGGNIVVISSKNVFDPGIAFGAYSASKAGAHQISKIAAMELAELGVRVNMVNPDAVFGDETVCSGLWELIGPDRMRSRGLKPEDLQDYYCRRSLLKVKVLAEHVGNAVVFFASELTPTTGASLPVDAGNPAAFPR